MAGDAPEIMVAVGLSEAPFDERAEDAIARLPAVRPGADPAIHLERMRQAVARGDVALLAVEIERERVGTIIVETRAWPDGVELFVLGAVGRRPGIDLCFTVWPALEEVCRASGVRWLSFETPRPGLVEKAREYGFEMRPILSKEIR